MIDDLTALRLQLDWGVDEALGEQPVNRFTATRPDLVPTLRVGPVVAAPPSGATARTMEALHAEMDAFTGCPLRATATHTVRPSGAAGAPILVVGDAPGSDDDRSGQAFSGAAGAILDRVFGSAGFDRGNMLLTTLVPWRPPGNRPASESEVQLCLPFLHRLIGIAQPRVLVLLGAGPTAALGRQTGTIRQLRGKWLDVQITNEQMNRPGLPMLPLAQWLRDGNTKQQLWFDMLLLREALRTT